MESKKEEISRIIKMLRKTMSPADIASKLDVSVVTLYRYESVKIDNPHRRVLKKLKQIKNILGILEGK